MLQSVWPRAFPWRKAFICPKCIISNAPSIHILISGFTTFSISPQNKSAGSPSTSTSITLWVSEVWCIVRTLVRCYKIISILYVSDMSLWSRYHVQSPQYTIYRYNIQNCRLFVQLELRGLYSFKTVMEVRSKTGIAFGLIVTNPSCNTPVLINDWNIVSWFLIEFRIRRIIWILLLAVSSNLLQ